MKEHKWKYLNEKSSKYTTSLKEYLDYIFPYNDFVYDSQYSKDIFEYRRNNRNIEYHRYRPDAISESLSLVVEFDGIDHYKSFNVISRDYYKNEWFKLLGYRVVRIPYWVQLSRENIKYYFNVYIEEEMCELKYSFFDSDIDILNMYQGANCSPGAMCEAGRILFVEQFNSLPEITRIIIYNDLFHCKYCFNPNCLVLPDYIEDKLDIPSKVFDYIDKHMEISSDDILRDIKVDVVED